jgi:hypothetical protein
VDEDEWVDVGGVWAASRVEEKVTHGAEADSEPAAARLDDNIASAKNSSEAALFVDQSLYQICPQPSSIGLHLGTPPRVCFISDSMFISLYFPVTQQKVSTFPLRLSHLAQSTICQMLNMFPFH